MTQSDRTDYIRGLRALADILDDNPDVPLPYGAGTSDTFKSDKLTWYVETKEEMQALVRAVPGPLEKEIDDNNPTYGFTVHGAIHGLHFYASVHRNEVCERVVKGTREVTMHVPDPTAEPVPLIEITKTVEDVEWVCSPLLAS